MPVSSSSPLRLSFSALLFLLTSLCLPWSVPAEDLDGTANGGRAVVKQGDSYNIVDGQRSERWGGEAATRSGFVDMQGGRTDQIFGGWSLGMQGTALYNQVIIRGGTISYNVYGGYAYADQFSRSSSNSVILSGGTSGSIMGGNADSSRARAVADNNIVLLRGGTSGSIMGGYASGFTGAESLYNLVSITGGETGDVIGGNATTTSGLANASFNTVLVNGGTIKGDIIAGLVHTGTAGQQIIARYNTVTLVSGTIGGAIYGSAFIDSRGGTAPLPAAGSGSTLNLLGWQGTLRRVAAFQYLNLALPNGMRPGETLLTLGNEQKKGDLQGGTVRILGALGGQGMRIGDRYTLINSIHADELALSNGGTVHDAPKGFALLFDGDMQRNGDSIDLTITGLRANPQIKAFNQYRVAQMAALDRGARLVEGTALEQARKTAAGQDAWMPFAAIHGGTERYGNDGRADGTGLELAAGLARSFTGEAGDLLLGAFFEYGQASIGTREDFSVGDVCGTGSARYAGGGLMARFDLTSGLLSGLYAQAGLRLGQINGDWQS